MSEKRCSATVAGDRIIWTPQQCSRNATVERNGKAFCGQHDPERVKARRVASTEKWKAESDERTRRYRRDELARDLADLAIREPETFPPNAQPIVQQLIALSPAAAPRTE